MISNTGPANLWFHALVEFERDLPSRLPAAAPASEPRAAFGDRRPVLLQSRAVGSAQSPDSRPPSGGGCAEGVYNFDDGSYRPAPLFLSQIAPLELV